MAGHRLLRRLDTHGAQATGRRFPSDVRWPGVLAAEVGAGAEVIEEGLTGGTTVCDDPYMEGRNGRAYLLPRLRSHARIDVLVVMLGASDTRRSSAVRRRDRGWGLRAAGRGAGVRDRPRRRRVAHLLIAPRGPAGAGAPRCGGSMRPPRPRARRCGPGRTVAAVAAWTPRRLRASGGDPGDRVRPGVDGPGVLGRAAGLAVLRVCDARSRMELPGRCSSAVAVRPHPDRRTRTGSSPATATGGFASGRT